MDSVKKEDKKIKEFITTPGKTKWDVFLLPLALKKSVFIPLFLLVVTFIAVWTLKGDSNNEAQANSSSKPLTNIQKPISKIDTKQSFILENYYLKEALKKQIATYLNTINWSDIENDAVIKIWILKQNPVVLMDSVNNIEMPRFISYSDESEDICDPLKNLAVQQNIRKIIPDYATGLEFKVNILAGGKLASDSPIFDLRWYKWVRN